MAADTTQLIGRTGQFQSPNSGMTLVRAAPKPPARGEILVRIRAAALNFADLLALKETYQEPTVWPHVPGMELAGEVVAAGEDVDRAIRSGPVALYTGRGGLADYGCFPAGRAVPLAPGTDWAEAAALPVTFGTAHLALTHRARLMAGETLVVLGAAGGAGLTAVQIGKRLGARVIGCARGADRLAAVSAAGADAVIDTGTDDLLTALRDLGGADVVYDTVGGEQGEAALRATRPDGRFLVIGFASGDHPRIRLNHLLVKNVTVIGFNWGGYLRFAPETLMASLGALFDWHSRGDIRPHIGHRFSLEDAEQGLALLRDRKATGKVVILP